MRSTSIDSRATSLLTFWGEAGFKHWFSKDTAFDETFRARFLELHEAAAKGELQGWLERAESALALVLLLDQFPRNSFRGTARMFATDALALAAAKSAVASGFDEQVDASLRVFFYLPFEHAEDLAEQERCVELCERLSNTEYTKYAVTHRDVIRRFGRFPHRNEVLGRETTREEQAFLASGGFAG